MALTSNREWKDYFEKTSFLYQVQTGQIDEISIDDEITENQKEVIF